MTASHECMRREFVYFFEELSRIRPVVLFLDDLHWADESTCDLLAYLGWRIRNIRILILMPYRPAAVLARQHRFLPLKLDLERRGICQDVPHATTPSAAISGIDSEKNTLDWRALRGNGPEDN